MTWQTPKTDWTPSQQGISDADFNRIEGNIEWLKSRRFFERNGSYEILGSGSENSAARVGHQVLLLPAGRSLILESGEARIQEESTTVWHKFSVSINIMGQLVSGDIVPYDPIILDSSDLTPSSSAPYDSGWGHYGIHTLPTQNTFRQNSSTNVEIVFVRFSVVRVPVVERTTSGTYAFNATFRIV